MNTLPKQSSAVSSWGFSGYITVLPKEKKSNPDNKNPDNKQNGNLKVEKKQQKDTKQG